MLLPTHSCCKQSPDPPHQVNKYVAYIHFALFIHDIEWNFKTDTEKRNLYWKPTMPYAHTHSIFISLYSVRYILSCSHRDKKTRDLSDFSKAKHLIHGRPGFKLKCIWAQNVHVYVHMLKPLLLKANNQLKG